MNHGESIPFEIEEEVDTRVAMLDFSLPRQQMIDLAPQIDELLIIDHHKTAQAALEGFGETDPGIEVIFDMNESGASLTWKYFWPEIPVPDLVRYIKDRDLWKYELYRSQEVNAYIQSFPMEFKSYQDLHATFQSVGIDMIAGLGGAIEQYKNTMVKRLCAGAPIIKVGGYYVPVVNTSLLMSEVGHELCLQHPEAYFGAYYFTRADGMVQWGMRSIGEFDVSEVAKKFGGGGHRNAAGFQLMAPEHYLLTQGQLEDAISAFLKR
jgi:oligoribonuclease NrnB/cAMP/cGMP phosphodiesterase (DHH superfamily)